MRECRIEGGVGKLYQDYVNTKSRYTKAFKKLSLLDQIYQGNLWKALGARFPNYQILPDTNDVAYVTDNIVASVYSVSKSADIYPTSEEDVQVIETLNIAMNHEWEISQIPQAQRKAGHHAALFNVAITQVGWDESLTSNLIMSHGGVRVRDVHPLKFMRDPYAPSFEESAYCFTTDRFHKSYFLENDLYKEAFEDYLLKGGDGKYGTVLPVQWEYSDESNPLQFPGTDSDYYQLVVAWYKVQDKDGNIVIDEYHTLGGSYLLHSRLSIEPGMFPFAVLYCNEPMGDLIGNSVPARILSNSIVGNIMDSENLTNVYRKIHPPKFISSDSQININTFKMYSNDPDYTFVVAGDATKALHYAEFPMVDSQGLNIQNRIREDVQRVSAVDGRYTGRNTGSITTTGGMQEMMDRMTLIDVPRIDRFENYTKKLTELVLRNLIEYAPKRKYIKLSENRKQSYVMQEVNFPELHKGAKEAVFSYQVHISSDLPRNRQRNADFANMLMEKQMQYSQAGMNVELITPEEWLRMQDIPNKELMLERMGLQRQQNALEDTSQVLFNYAELVKNGMSPEDAMLATANDLDARRQGKQMGNPDELMNMGISMGDPLGVPNQLGEDAATGLPTGMDPGMLQQLMQ